MIRAVLGAFRTGTVMALVVVTACGVQNRSLQRYAGSLVSQSPNCPALKATLLNRDGIVVFSPNEATWTLEGKAVGNTISASRSRPGVEHKLYVTTLSAAFDGTTVSGSYKTPSCDYAVQLTRY